MGASHIFITAAFAWGGNIMKSLQRVLRSFIEDGSVSMTSHADDALDFLYSVRGLSFHRDNLKVFQVVYLMYYIISVVMHLFLWTLFDHFIFFYLYLFNFSLLLLLLHFLILFLLLHCLLSLPSVRLKCRYLQILLLFRLFFIKLHFHLHPLRTLSLLLSLLDF